MISNSEINEEIKKARLEREQMCELNFNPILIDEQDSFIAQLFQIKYA